MSSYAELSDDSSSLWKDAPYPVAALYGRASVAGGSAEVDEFETTLPRKKRGERAI